MVAKQCVKKIEYQLEVPQLWAVIEAKLSYPKPYVGASIANHLGPHH